jgi:plastocyanin domain-containing protein
MDKIVITIIGMAMIAFIYWFFFGAKNEREDKDKNQK